MKHTYLFLLSIVLSIVLAACQTSKGTTPPFLNETLPASAKTQASSPIRAWQLRGEALGVEVRGVDEQGTTLEILTVSLFDDDHNQLHVSDLSTSGSHKESVLIEYKAKADSTNVYASFNINVDAKGNATSSQVGGNVNEITDNMQSDLQSNLFVFEPNSLGAAQAKLAATSMNYSQACVVSEVAQNRVDFEENQDHSDLRDEKNEEASHQPQPNFEQLLVGQGNCQAATDQFMKTTHDFLHALKAR